MSTLSDIEVLPQDERPARRDGKCFYCYEPLRGRHRVNCAVLAQTVVIRYVVTVTTDIWAGVDKEMWESSWDPEEGCDDLLEAALRFADGEDDVHVTAEWVTTTDAPLHRGADPEPIDGVYAVVCEIANRRCREGINPICASRFPDERHRWCEPCLAGEALLRQMEEDMGGDDVSPKRIQLKRTKGWRSHQAIAWPARADGATRSTGRLPGIRVGFTTA